jgi:hypothetical protein
LSNTLTITEHVFLTGYEPPRLIQGRSTLASSIFPQHHKGAIAACCHRRESRFPVFSSKDGPSETFEEFRSPIFGDSLAVLHRVPGCSRGLSSHPFSLTARQGGASSFVAFLVSRCLRDPDRIRRPHFNRIRDIVRALRSRATAPPSRFHSCVEPMQTPGTRSSTRKAAATAQ